MIGSLFGLSFSTIAVYDHYLDFVNFNFIFLEVGVEVKNRVLGNSLSSSLQLVRIDSELLHDKIGFKFGVPCE